MLYTLFMYVITCSLNGLRIHESKLIYNVQEIVKHGKCHLFIANF